MINKPPSASLERTWLSRIADYGCVILRQKNGLHVTGGIQLHHIGGRELKQSKYHIGRWFVMPLSWCYHDVYSDDPLNVTHHKNAFTEEFGRQCDLFKAMCEKLEDDGPLPFCDGVMNAIMETGR